MPQFFRPLQIAVAALVAMSTLGAWAQDRRGHGPPGGRGAPPPGWSGMQGMGDRGAPTPRRREDDMSDSVRNVERSHRGQILSAERIQSDGREVNRIKLMDDRGRVRVFTDDPQQRRDPSPTRDDDN